MSFNIFRGVIGAALRTRGISGALQTLLKYNYNTYRAAFLKNHDRPETVDEARKLVRDDFACAKEVGLMTSEKDCLRILTGAEFRCNGYTLPNGLKQWDASAPIRTELYDAIKAETAIQARNAPEGVVYCPGSYAIDTGLVNSDGKKIGVNRGLVIQCGSSNYELVEFTKKVPSNIDGWDYSLYAVQDGDGAKVVRFEDVQGGRSATGCFGICLDIDTSIREHKQRYDLIVLPSAGAPIPDTKFKKAEHFNNAEIIVNDAIYNPFHGDYTEDQTHIWIPQDNPLYPILGDIWKTLEGFPTAYAAIYTILNGWLAIDLEKLDATFKVYEKTNAVESHLPGKIMVMKNRSIPLIVQEDSLPKTAERVQKGATIVDEFQDYPSRIEEMQSDLPWDYIRGEIEKAVAAETQDHLEKLGDLSAKKVADLTKLVNTEDFRGRVRNRVADIVSTAMSGADGFPDLSSQIERNLRDGIADQLVDQVVTNPLWGKITGSTPVSYLSSLVTLSVASEVQHAAREAGNTVQRLAAAEQTVDQTQGEVDSKQKALQDVQDRLKQKPDTPDLKKQGIQLEAELENLRKEIKEASNALDEARRNRDADVDSSTSKADADRDIEKSGKDIFPKGE